MKSDRSYCTFFALAMVACLTGCGSEFTHVKPGQSARQSVAERNAPKPTVVPGSQPTPAGERLSNANPNAAGPLIPPPLPPDIRAEPAPPEANDIANRVADAYTRGTFAMQAGQHVEAITALEEAVKLDPNFTDAWTKLVKLYEVTGNREKAAQAYKKLKQLGQPNGSGSSAAAGGIGLSR
jgi:hypothetical protein